MGKPHAKSTYLSLSKPPTKPQQRALARLTKFVRPKKQKCFEVPLCLGAAEQPRVLHERSSGRQWSPLQSSLNTSKEKSYGSPPDVLPATSDTSLCSCLEVRQATRSHRTGNSGNGQDQAGHSSLRSSEPLGVSRWPRAAMCRSLSHACFQSCRTFRRQSFGLKNLQEKTKECQRCPKSTEPCMVPDHALLRNIVRAKSSMLQECHRGLRDIFCKTSAGPLFGEPGRNAGWGPKHQTLARFIHCYGEPLMPKCPRSGHSPRTPLLQGGLNCRMQTTRPLIVGACNTSYSLHFSHSS